MVANNKKYLLPMAPWPTLESYRQEISLPVNDLNLFYYKAGNIDLPTMIMIHGLGDDADTWRHVFYPLSKLFHVIAIDLPGFGRSEKPKITYSPSFYIESILKFMDTLSIKSAILMGSSLGGIIAHEMAIEHVNRVTGLILVGGALYQQKRMGDLGLLLMQIPYLGEWLYTKLRKNPKAAYESLRSVYYELGKMPMEDREFLFERVNKRVWSDDQRRAYFSTLRATAKWVKKQQKNIIINLQRIQIPTLILRGDYDHLFSKNNAVDLISIQPEVDYFKIEDAGHLPHQENPDLFLAKLIPWLETHFS